MGLCDLRQTQATAHWLEREECHAVIDGLRLYVRAVEHDYDRLKASDHWSLEWNGAEHRIEEDVAAGRISTVRYLMWHEEKTGEVVQTTDSFADALEKYGIAVRVSDAEADAAGKRNRQRAGGWMDDERWKSFTGNYRRVRTALSSKRQTQKPLTSGTRAAVAA